MPSKYVVRSYKKDAIYHLFNRGVDQKTIFRDDDDYQTFYYYLYVYLHPIDKVYDKYPQLPLRFFKKNLAKEISLYSYCLMPTHFHLLVKQHTSTAIPLLMKQLTNAYTQYFNTKYKRTGSLFEGRYKAVEIEKEGILTGVSRFIHLDPVVSGLVQDAEYSWSSYNEYANAPSDPLCDTAPLLQLFPSIYAYKKFVADHKAQKKHLSELKHFIFGLTDNEH